MLLRMSLSSSRSTLLFTFCAVTYISFTRSLVRAKEAIVLIYILVTVGLYRNWLKIDTDLRNLFNYRYCNQYVDRDALMYLIMANDILHALHPNIITIAEDVRLILLDSHCMLVLPFHSSYFFPVYSCLAVCIYLKISRPLPSFKINYDLALQKCVVVIIELFWQVVVIELWLKDRCLFYNSGDTLSWIMWTHFSRWTRVWLLR